MNFTTKFPKQECLCLLMFFLKALLPHLHGNSQRLFGSKFFCLCREKKNNSPQVPKLEILHIFLFHQAFYSSRHVLKL
ncbi:hypothetical protein GLOIN_2v1497076 [Rhizophagus irregularis DAOM 181602=DAOM 197198]|uniref:Uncharacterized protein n=1 Tax=Rhizophagus irregularis (strain DAOM 181602 / DAOM 197198 / MUCL 43194) TaxID=747089 RepID=A0A2P4QYC2_RHIID|nr:hypothetical protein GLOIN_2v1497076 [Rhizophagus irregularis DAOM 181602=DAOM 197198]POG82660.1 hypothetical protein GLOIN_2v1497076 [Rhizophagus irregularis DAOM 181602=DAOM 197198]GET52213.1 hypothetical protein GLOIN_2v1497076 [Rhizophagus irregularis DAOM 181602=DAOM 197198]|eukprot:XP_025189526.1 hypothetical protein GLOIN_2v1497076 [Rhizophagus irregularis DAOM 181602=DAOM 197198]